MIKSGSKEVKYARFLELFLGFWSVLKSFEVKIGESEWGFEAFGGVFGESGWKKRQTLKRGQRI